MNNKLKNKKRIITKLFAYVTCALSIVSVGAALLIKDNYKQAKAISYDDENKTITFTAYECNNYHFDNLDEYLSYFDEDANSPEEEFPHTQNCIFYYDDVELECDGSIVFYEGSYDVTGEPVAIFFNINHKFTLEDYGDNNTTFEHDLILASGGTAYNAIKAAVELDYDANYVEHSIGLDTIAGIASGLGLTTSLASEFLNGFTSLFWVNNQLTNFAIFSLIMLGIAITFAVVKLIMALIRSNTGA